MDILNRRSAGASSSGFMAALKLFIFTVFISLILTHIRADADSPFSVVDDEVQVSRSDGSDSVLIELLKSKIHTLESHIEEKAQEIKRKDEVIATKEKIIKEKSNSITSLQNEIGSLQKKGTLAAEEQLGKAHARAEELERQVEKLKTDIEVKTKEKDLFKAREEEAVKKTVKLNAKVESLQKVIDEQKTKLRKTERALHVAEDELMKVKSEYTSKTRELMEVHGAWLPPWLAVHFSHYQSLLEKNWNVHARPALEMAMQKAIEKKAQLEEWAAPHVETMKTKWIPALTEQWMVVKTNAEPHVQMLTMKTLEIYEVSKNTVTPHIIRVQEIADPYFQVRYPSTLPYLFTLSSPSEVNLIKLQELRKFSKPYIDQVATSTRPHVDKIRTTLKPYTKKAVHAYGKFLESATVYHHQVQDAVHEKLKSHELTRPLATRELVWFVASAVLAVPIIILFKICSGVFCKKAKKPIRNGNLNHPRRKVKRGHADK
ncbi:structural maintenance of chromosomes 2-1-like [Olea europaea subsp. europaea]|uniref:Structural maintenance of chromosomes 2-1-like n=1 Tax=Olea europaea subsp. europaea TaxID=158383 RepID=A0A8S0Q2C6_OLEEU|nr:structural maintenance of chromosomes 2-1-like [Olea europaea subsp. europaea]